jgi:hypothetical protein
VPVQQEVGSGRHIRKIQLHIEQCVTVGYNRVTVCDFQHFPSPLNLHIVHTIITSQRECKAKLHKSGGQSEQCFRTPVSSATYWLYAAKIKRHLKGLIAGIRP